MNINTDTVGNVFFNHSKVANVRQTRDGTSVIDVAGDKVSMPKTRYKLSNPAGANEFYSDLRVALNLDI
ncbi:MAG: hypothetical protein Dbin4_02695 [Alphaproteobacteria bacterium]|nr:hypothetical protein [Alphaproteobacteria bacterium]